MKKNGVLLHISSLPSDYGIGTLGKSAFSFVDFLADCGVGYWQTLPICMTTYGDSPYQSPSAFAGNPYFIDIDILHDEGLLSDEELASARADNKNDIDYARLFNTRFNVLRQAFSRFKPDNSFNAFVNDNIDWLYNFALFISLKTKFGFEPFDKWPSKYRYADKLSQTDIDSFKNEMDFHYFIQYEFDKQMSALKKYANARGVKLVGDIPIYVAYDSADVWGNGKLFKLNKLLKPTCVAGVPPDYFSETGQLWGNPLFHWPNHEKQCFDWWHKRIKRQLKYFDMLRIDHFRGFESYYQIPFGNIDATVGKWSRGPRLKVFEDISTELVGKIIAEDLGLITKPVKKMVKDSGFSGMKVFQFAFDGKPDNEHLPQNVKQDVVYYTGTHDNDTLYGWLKKLTLSELVSVNQCVGGHYTISENTDETMVYEDIIACTLATVMKSKSDLVIVPMQDYLLQDNSARMNMPGSTQGNWKYVLPDNYADCKDLIKISIKFRK